MSKVVSGISVIALILSSVALYYSTKQPNIAYVRSGELVYSYEGMVDAQAAFKLKQDARQANIDSLKMELDRAYNSYMKDLPVLPKKKQKERQLIFQDQENTFRKYVENMRLQDQKDESEMTETVLLEVNNFVEKYGKDKGVDIILGTTNSGNLLYGINELDITSSLLTALNKEYSKTPKLLDK